MEKLEDLSKMKVADLKKHLKDKGLSVAGNKTELVERLQQALQSDGTPTLDSAGGGEEEEFDEEEILGGDDDDGSKITQEEEAAALADVKVKGDSKAKPSEKKRVSLKRSQPSLGTKETAEESAADESVVSIPEADLSSEKENLTTTEDEPSKHKKIKLTEEKDDKDVLEARAKKFGTSANDDTEEGRKVTRAARFGVEAAASSPANQNKRAPKLSMDVGSTDLDKLKKRAERFGEVTSKSLSKLEELEKKKQRKDRFTESENKEDETKTESEKKDVSSDAVKTVRAERFGATKENGTTKVPITAPGGGEDDAKKKRAQRFA